MRIIITLSFFLMTCIYANAQTPADYCRDMGDNRLSSWIGAFDSQQTAIPVEKGYFVFQNSGKGRVSFTYGNVIIDLAVNGLSMPIKGNAPTSLPDCNVKIDNIPLSEYYKIVNYEQTYQDFSERMNSLHFRRFNAGEDELKAGIASCNQTLQQLSSHASTIPNWFRREWSHDHKVNQTKTWLKAFQDALNEKKNSDVSGNAGVTNNQQNSSGTSSYTSTSNNAVSQPYRIEQHRLQEEAAARQLAELNSSNAEREALANAVGEGIEQLGSMIANSMAASNIANERARLRTAAFYEARRKEGEQLINKNIRDANSGNERAIAEVIKGYQNIGIDASYLKFAHQMVNKHNSATARKSLASYYTEQMLQVKKESNRYLRRGITGILFGAAAVGGALYASDYILENYDIYEDPDAATFYEATDYVAAGAIVLSIVGSGISFSKVGYKRDNKYIEAQNKLYDLEQRSKISFGPAYFKREKNIGLALTLQF